MQRTLVLGGPGAGKTHSMMDVAERMERDGFPPWRGALMSYTRRAAREGKERACAKFGIDPRRLPWFGSTLHSMCFRETGANRETMLKPRHVRKVATSVGVVVSVSDAIDDEFDVSGDRMLFLIDLARATMRPLRETFERHWDGQVEWAELDRLDRALRHFKEREGLTDYADLLERFVERDEPIDVDYAIVDEAQDLTPIQWRVVDVAFRNARSIWYAGDDDQAIYEWSGADTRRFLSLEVDERVVLPRSHRLPRLIFDAAKRQAKRIGRRYAKEWGARDEDGTIEGIEDLSQFRIESGTTCLMTRNRCWLPDLMAWCEAQPLLYETRDERSVPDAHARAIVAYEAMREGRKVDPDVAEIVAGLARRRLTRVPKEPIGWDEVFGPTRVKPPWHEGLSRIAESRRAYYKALLDSDQGLSDQPTVRVETIHGMKGGEADTVVLLTDMTRLTARGMEQNPDAEARVWYVGMTRARKRLVVVRPQTPIFYELCANA